jgi:transposase
VSKRRLVITAVLAGQSQSEVARTYGVSQGWISRLMALHSQVGEAAFEPASRRPKTSPRSTAPHTVELVVRLRKELAGDGLYSGPHTIAWDLTHHHGITIWNRTTTRPTTPKKELARTLKRGFGLFRCPETSHWSRACC